MRGVITVIVAATLAVVITLAFAQVCGVIR